MFYLACMPMEDGLKAMNGKRLVSNDLTHLACNR
jgi:hypothetical protein